MGSSDEVVDVVIVGAGMMGLRVAKTLAEQGLSFHVLDRQREIGGVWHSYANASSRVQILEPAYRLLEDAEGTDDFTPKHALEAEMARCVALHVTDNPNASLTLGANVTRTAHTVVGGETLVEVEYDVQAASGRSQLGRSESRTIHARDAVLCTGGLQTPRVITHADEVRYKGQLVEGVGGEVDRIDFTDKRVAILGMGAFGVENARTALLGGAEHVTIICRRANLVVPRILAFFSFPSQTEWQQFDNKQGGGAMTAGLMAWPYLKCGMPDAMPPSLKNAVGKGGAEHTGELMLGSAVGSLGGLTLPAVSDYFFMALEAGKLTVLQEGAESFTSDSVVTVAGTEVKSDVVVKCYGFEDPDHLPPPPIRAASPTTNGAAASTGSAGSSGVDGSGGLSQGAGLVEEQVNLMPSSESMITSPLWLSEHIVLIKAEHPAAFTGDTGEIIDFPASGVLLADVQIAIWRYFRERPGQLRELSMSVSGGPLEAPQPLGEESLLQFSASIWGLMQAEPELRAELDGVRAAFSKQIRDHYAELAPGPMGKAERSFQGFTRQNRTDWETDAVDLLGEGGVAVPWMWAGVFGDGGKMWKLVTGLAWDGQLRLAWGMLQDIRNRDRPAAKL